MSLFIVRPYQSTDESFVYSTWLKGLYYGNDWFKEIERDTYFKKYHQVIENVLSRPNVSIRCACLKEDPDVILSYAVLEKNDVEYTLHWIFTKSGWRKLGLSKLILPEVSHVSTLTKVGRAIKPAQWKFDPFLI